MYNIMKFIHVAAMTLLIGGLHMMLLLNVRFAKAGETAGANALAQQAKFLSTRVFIPLALVILISGIGMVQWAKYGFDLLWIQYGTGGLILAMIIGNAFIGRIAMKLGRQVAAGEIDQATAMAARKKLIMYAGLNLLLLLSIVYVMVVKPA